jgi:hypothetical protein
MRVLVMTRKGVSWVVRIGGACALLVAAACGRLGFGERPDGGNGNGGDAGRLLSPDGPSDIGKACQGDSDCMPCEGCEGGSCTAEPLDLQLGHRTTCFIGNSGSRWCVGEEPGLGSDPPSNFPQRIVGEDGWTLLAPGYGASFGIRNAETYEWGDDSGAVPGVYYTDGTYTSIEVQLSDFCLQHADEDLLCDGNTITGTWISAAAGYQAFCGVQSDNSLWCWGMDVYNVLGQGVEANGTVIANPARVGADSDWAAAAIGDALACAQKLDGTLWCWGLAAETGLDGADSMGVPAEVSTDTDWTWFAVRWTHACAGKADGSVWCWGDDDYGLDVVPGTDQVNVPTELPQAWDRFVMGGHHYCALTGTTWYCWGWNAAGQLGIGTQTTHDSPTAPFCTQGT